MATRRKPPSRAPSPPPSRVTRAKRRDERKAARDHRRREREASGISASLTATPDDEHGRPNLLPAQQLRRRRTFELIERTCGELVAVRGRQVLALLLLSPGTDEHSALARAIEALDDEIDDLRELSDDLLRRVAPLEVADDRLAQLEQMLSAAQTLANVAARAQALLGAAQQLLAAIDDAIDGAAEA